MDLPQFRTVFVRCPRHDSLLVRWSLSPTTYPLDQIEFEIFRSLGSAGPWDFIGTAEPGAFHFYDFDIEGPHTYRNFYYIVRIADTKGAGFVDSSPEVLTHDPDNIAIELVRKKNVYLTVRGGIRGAVLSRKRWGAKCPRCWNKERQLPSDADCLVCYGTGYARGYCEPVITPAGVMGPTNKEYAEVIGKVEIGQSGFEISNMPLVEPKDIFIDTILDERYHIDRVTANTHRGYVVSQLIVCTRVDDNAAVYHIRIPESLASRQGQSFNLSNPPVQ